MSNPLKDGAERAASFASEKAGAARAAANDAFEGAKIKLNDAYGSARDTASHAGQRAADGVNEAPLSVLASGLALGAILGALLPSSRREAEILGPLGEKIGEATRGATEAAKAAGFAKLGELGISRENAKAQVDQFVEAVTQSVSTAGSAAAESVRKK